MRKKKSPGGNAKLQTEDLTHISEQVLEALKAQAGRPMGPKQIATLVGLKWQNAQEELMHVLGLLSARGQLERVGPGKYRWNVQNVTYIGKYEHSRDGYYFVKVDELDGDEVVILEEGSRRAFIGDQVGVRIVSRGKKNAKGVITEILARRRTEFVGTMDVSARAAFFIPQDSKVKTDFIIPKKFLHEAENGDKVVIRLVRWDGNKPEGEVINVLGKLGEHKAEMNAIILEFNLPETFSPEVEEYANRIPADLSPEEIRQRRDFRSILTFTIDPVDAKDFDDALSFRVISEDTFEVGVHIADVTHYLHENTPLDKEAYDRATSVYLVDRTIPMLPERLSNNLCSLVPHQDRLTFSAVFIMNRKGEVLEEWIGRTVIHSQHRFAYEDVHQILETGQGEYVNELRILNEIAYGLRKERFANGSINFETEEVRFKLDEDMKPVSVYVKERNDAHKLVEDFMLLANRRVARLMGRIRPRMPFVYRVHAVPDKEKLQQLKSFVKYFGYDIDTTDSDTVVRSLNRLVADVEGKPEQNIVQSVAIRSMPKAVYTTSNIGHYGLGFQDYCHFTSPIRRYPDVMAHRLLAEVLKHGLHKEDADALEKKCKYCSELEKRAADAERASVKYKQIEFLERLVGQEFDGIVSGVTNWGIYVELAESKCEGMVSLRDMRDDVYYLDDSKYRLTGKHTGKTFMLGDKVRILVKKTNLVKRVIDFELVGAEASAKRPEQARPDSRRRSSASKSRPR